MGNRLKKIVAHPHFIPWLLFTFFFCLYFSSTVGIMNSGDGPEYALTQAIVEEQTTQIDNFSKYAWPDYALVNNHLYSKRSPGTSFLAIPFYILAKTLRPFALPPYLGQHPGINQASSTEVLTMILPVLLSSLTIVIVYLVSLQLTKNKLASLLTSFILGTGTLLWRYSYSFLRQPAYIFLLTFSFLLLLKVKTSTKPVLLTIMYGLAVGYSVVVESTAIFVFPILYLALFIIIRQTNKQNLFKLSLAVILSSAVAISILPIYNWISFDQLHRNLYQDIERGKWMNYNSLFSTPLFPSLWINLFSYKPIPLEALSPVLRNNPRLFAQESANWAIVYSYKGIFLQSPYLFVAVFGFIFFIKKFKQWALIALGVFLSILVPLSKYVDFYSPNDYTTRFFLPAIPFLTLGFAFWLERLIKARNRFLQIILVLLTIVLAIVSIYNAWFASLTNYAPHVTDEHRFSFDQLRSPLLASQNLSANLSPFPQHFPQCLQPALAALLLPSALFHHVLFQQDSSLP